MKTRIWLAVLVCIIMPFLYFVVLGGLQDRWFDIREWRQDPEGEIPYIEEWKYSAFYAVMIVMSLLQLFLICLYCIKTWKIFQFRHLIIYLIICVVMFIWFVMSEVYLLTLPFTDW